MATGNGTAETGHRVTQSPAPRGSRQRSSVGLRKQRASRGSSAQRHCSRRSGPGGRGAHGVGTAAPQRGRAEPSAKRGAAGRPFSAQDPHPLPRGASPSLSTTTFAKSWRSTRMIVTTGGATRIATVCFQARRARTAFNQTSTLVCPHRVEPLAAKVGRFAAPGLAIPRCHAALGRLAAGRRPGFGATGSSHTSALAAAGGGASAALQMERRLVLRGVCTFGRCQPQAGPRPRPGLVRLVGFSLDVGAAGCSGSSTRGPSSGSLRAAAPQHVGGACLARGLCDDSGRIHVRAGWQGPQLRSGRVWGDAGRRDDGSCSCPNVLQPHGPPARRRSRSTRVSCPPLRGCALSRPCMVCGVGSGLLTAACRRQIRRPALANDLLVSATTVCAAQEWAGCALAASARRIRGTQT